MKDQRPQLTLPAINVRAPWARLLVTGVKSVETRHYPLPENYLKRPVIVIETSGKTNGPRGTPVGLIVFESFFQYASRQAFYKDYPKHLVDKNSEFGWSDEKGKKWGWVVSDYASIDHLEILTKKTGIVFSRNVPVGGSQEAPRQLLTFLQQYPT